MYRKQPKLKVTMKNATQGQIGLDYESFVSHRVGPLSKGVKGPYHVLFLSTTWSRQIISHTRKLSGKHIQPFFWVHLYML